MLDTYIKNRGSTKTIIHDNNKNHVNVIKWDADYDGNEANISLDLNNNNKSEHYNIKLDNDDLANILNVNSVKTPIDKRLKSDFKKANFYRDPSVYNIYLDDFKAPDLMPKSVSQNQLISKYRHQTLDEPIINELLQITAPNNSHFSSPLTDEELIIPLTIDKDSNTLVDKNKTHRVYKHKSKLSAAKGLKKSKTKRKTRRKHRKIGDNLRSLLHI